MVDNILMISLFLIFFGLLFSVIRLIRGPSAIDRVVAVDLITMIALSLVVAIAHFAKRFIYVDVAMVYALLSFLSVLAVARYWEKGHY